jgi:hypothetical protein
LRWSPVEHAEAQPFEVLLEQYGHRTKAHDQVVRVLGAVHGRLGNRHEQTGLGPTDKSVDGHLDGTQVDGGNLLAKLGQ